MRIKILLALIGFCPCAFQAALAGNDTSPAWSPDGKTIAYVSDADGGSKLKLLDVKTREVRAIDIGAGDVFQPAWTRDGGIVFSRYRPNGTAFQTKKDSTARLCLWRNGHVEELPSDPQPGRDYAPCVAQDGTVYFTTTRGLDSCNTALAKISPSGTVSHLVGGGRKEEGCVSATLSPDGRTIAYAYLDGLYSQWRIAASSLDSPNRRLMLTPHGMYAYSPRFSPDGKRIAFTGFRTGETGWGIFVQDLASGETFRIDTGLAGNSRSPDWSPDGSRLVFENNASGAYKICFTDVQNLVPGTGEMPIEPPPQPAKRTDSFTFGDQDFYIRARVRVDRLAPGQFVFFLRAAYDEHPLGIQLYLDGKHLPTFSTRRASDGNFVMAQGTTPFPVGREVELLGIRERMGRISLYIDGALAASTLPGRMLALDHLKKVDKSPSLLSLEIGTGTPSEVLANRATRLGLFGSPASAASHALPPARPFEVMAFADSLDFGAHMDSETATGNIQILDHILETGADVILWRTGAGATTRYPSREEPAAYCPAEIRRLPDNRKFYGFLRYPDASPDILKLIAKTCAERGLRFGNHSPFEETHWTSWTFGVWNAEHPQYWSRAQSGTPWAGRCSLAFDEVRAHKLRLAEEVLAYGSKDYFLDCWRNGGWGPQLEFVEPELRRWRTKHGDIAPTNGPAWRAHVFESTHMFFSGLSARVRAHGGRFLLGVPFPDDVDGEDSCMKRYGIDWRACVDAGEIDCLLVINPDWDVKRPFESTREIYQRIVRRCAGKCRVYFPVSAYDFCRKGVPSYCKATGKSFADVAETLTRMAFEVGGDGITLECVDYNNYPTPARQRLREVIASIRAAASSSASR